MDLAKHIDLSVLIAEHFRNARTGGEVDLLEFSWTKFKYECKKDNDGQYKSEKFLAQNKSSRKIRADNFQLIKAGLYETNRIKYNCCIYVLVDRLIYLRNFLLWGISA